MATIILRIDPARLENADLDIRYVLPELLAERSGGAIADDGFDYADDDTMELYLAADDGPAAVELINRILESEVVLGNHLAGRVEVTIEE